MVVVVVVVAVVEVVRGKRSGGCVSMAIIVMITRERASLRREREREKEKNEEKREEGGAYLVATPMAVTVSAPTVTGRLLHISSTRNTLIALAKDS